MRLKTLLREGKYSKGVSCFLSPLPLAATGSFPYTEISLLGLAREHRTFRVMETVRKEVSIYR